MAWTRQHSLNLTGLYCACTYGRGSVLFWRRSDTLCTSGFMDDVIFAHKPRLLDVAVQLKRSAHAALGVAINRAQYYHLQAKGTHGTTDRELKVTSQVATPGAESAVYDCLVVFAFGRWRRRRGSWRQLCSIRHPSNVGHGGSN